MKEDSSNEPQNENLDKNNFIIPNNIGDKLPLYYNYVRCTVLGDNVQRINISYYDRKFNKFRIPKFSNDFSRILD